MSQQELEPGHILEALQDALMQMRIDCPGFEAVSSHRVDEARSVTVELRGAHPVFTRDACVCKDEDDEMCVPCIEAEEHQWDEPDYLTVVVKIESAVIA